MTEHSTCQLEKMGTPYRDSGAGFIEPEHAASATRMIRRQEEIPRRGLSPTEHTSTTLLSRPLPPLLGLPAALVTRIPRKEDCTSEVDSKYDPEYDSFGVDLNAGVLGTTQNVLDTPNHSFRWNVVTITGDPRSRNGGMLESHKYGCFVQKQTFDGQYRESLKMRIHYERIEDDIAGIMNDEIERFDGDNITHLSRQERLALYMKETIELESEFFESMYMYSNLYSTNIIIYTYIMSMFFKCNQQN